MSDEQLRRVMLEALFARKDRLCSQIDEMVASSLGYEAKQLSEAQKNQIAEEIEGLLENRDMADLKTGPGKLSANSNFQKLMREHREICEEILDKTDEGLPDHDDDTGLE